MSPPRPNASCIVDISLFSEVVKYDLEQMDADPQAIIFLLSLTLDQRGLWMVVAAFYRAKGNPVAAIAVLDAFLKHMSQQGVSDTRLRPAFVLMSGCEMDLAHKKKGGTLISDLEVSEHCQRAENWLHRAFGTDPPASLLRHDLNQQTTLLNTHRPAGIQDSIFHETNNQREMEQQKVFEREIQTLKVIQEDQSTEMERARAAKRRLEDEYTRERNARKRAEKRNKDLEKDLDDARRVLGERTAQANPRGGANRENNGRWGHRDPLTPMRPSLYRSRDTPKVHRGH